MIALCRTCPNESVTANRTLGVYRRALGYTARRHIGACPASRSERADIPSQPADPADAPGANRSPNRLFRMSFLGVRASTSNFGTRISSLPRRTMAILVTRLKTAESQVLKV